MKKSILTKVFCANRKRSGIKLKVTFFLFSAFFLKINAKTGIDTNDWLLNAITADVNVMQQTISGNITDKSGMPLAGATVVIKNTSIGAVTDFDGNYSIEAPNNSSVLLVSYVGYKDQEIPVNNRTTIDIVLEEDAAQLDEVVLIGYGTQKKATVTGSISTVKGEELLKNASSNLTTALQGQLPGLTANIRTGEPGAESTEILIRGKSTLGNNNVLVVIDGVVGGSIQSINPADIESFSVLKDASAAIYGARAANGVVLITTKRGKTGAPSISYTGDFSVTQPTRQLDLMDSWQYAVAENEYLVNNGLTTKWTDEDITLFQNGTDPLFHPNVDWYDVAFREWTPQKQHNLSISGGSDDIKYYLSGRIIDQDRNFKENDGKGLDRYQIRANIDAQLTKTLKVGVNMNYQKDLIEDAYLGNSRVYWQARGMTPNQLAFWPNGLPGNTSFGLNPALMGSSEKFGYNRQNTFSYNTKLSFDLDLSRITNGLSIAGWGNFTDWSQSFEKFFKQSYFYNYDQVNDVYVEIPAGQTTQSPELLETSNRSQSKTYNLKLAYKNSFGEHNVDAFAAVEQFESNYAGFTAYRKDFLTDQLPVLSAGSQEAKDNSGYKSDAARINYFGRVNYDYKEKYLLGATVRYDGSQNFPEDNRFGFFPSVSAGWVLSKEPFIKENLGFINQFKIKGSWGQLGNDNVDAFQYLATYGFGQGYYFGESAVLNSGYLESTVPNPNITWEVAETVNFGFESKLFRGLLDFNFDVFKSTRTNILTQKNASTPDYTGLTLPDVNIGEVESSGYEIELGHSNNINENLGYSISTNLSYAKNEVVFLDEPEDGIPYQRATGYPIDSYLLYKADGIYQTQAEINATPHLPNTAPGDIKYVDVSEDGVIDADDRIREDLSATPQVMYGINLGLTYKNWDFSMLIQGQAKAKLKLIPEGLYMDKEFFDGRWQEEGDNLYPRSFNSDRQAVGNNALPSTFWLKNGAFMRMKNIQLAYTFPKSFTDIIHVSNFRVYASGSNLFMIHDDIKIVDPETLSNGTADLARYPVQRLLNFGVNVTF